MIGSPASSLAVVTLRRSSPSAGERCFNVGQGSVSLAGRGDLGRVEPAGARLAVPSGNAGRLGRLQLRDAG